MRVIFTKNIDIDIIPWFENLITRVREEKPKWLDIFFDCSGGNPMPVNLVKEQIRELERLSYTTAICAEDCDSSSLYLFILFQRRRGTPGCRFILHRSRYSFDRAEPKFILDTLHDRENIDEKDVTEFLTRFVKSKRKQKEIRKIIDVGGDYRIGYKEAREIGLINA